MIRDCKALKQTKALLFKRSALLVALFCCFCVFSADAQSMSATYGGSPASLSFGIPVSASVSIRCGFAAGAAPAGTFDAGAIDRTGWSNDFAFTLDCNGPSRIAIASRNAGLKADLPKPVPGYASLAPYTVAVSIALGTGTRDASCTSAQLASKTGSGCAFAGTASATEGLLVPAAASGLPGSFMRVSAPAYLGANVLVSGVYADTLTVTIAPAS